MYAKIDLTGDGIVEESCNSTYINKKYDNVIPGNLGLYSGTCPLPQNNGHLYKLSNYYEPMPEYKQEIKFLSKMGLTQMPDYKVVNNPLQNELDGYFYPSDSRVIDPVRNIKTILDKPAEVGSVDMDLVGNFDNSNYGSVYRTYSDIKNGQIAYYVDPSISQPFFAPVYTISSYVDKIIFKDPMDSVKPEYIKTPVTSTLNSTEPCSQTTRDALFFREDLMSRQQNLYNRTSWTNRWIKP
jgi:hypothetical protein